jgi:hypothetical protein
MQLSFPFVSTDVDMSTPRLSPYRRRMRAIAGRAYELGRRRAEARHLAEPLPKSLGAARVMTRPVANDERIEIGELARRVARLGPSHKRPEQFHEDKSSIVHELRLIAHR